MLYGSWAGAYGNFQFINDYIWLSDNAANYDLDPSDAHWNAWVLDNTVVVAGIQTVAAVPGASVAVFGLAAATSSEIGVPMVGFAAVRGNTGDASKNVGETVPHSYVRSRGSL